VLTLFVLPAVCGMVLRRQKKLEKPGGELLEA
jgi:cobalt-zinc-cadmium resistance protein CzcA